MSTALDEIRLLLATYNISGDRLQLDALADTFAEKGVLETPTALYQGKAAIWAGLAGGGGRRDRSRPHTFTRHHLTTSTVQITGPGQAEGRTYFQVYTNIGLDHLGYYDDRLGVEWGVWRFLHRRVRLDWISDETLMPSLLAAHRARLERRA